MMRLFSFLLLSLMATWTFADSIHWGNYTIHYTALSSRLIPDEVAKRHRISRADNSIIVNVVIRKDGRAVRADVTGTVTNLLNRVANLQFREITEQDAVYYLASHTADQTETLRFEIDIKPAGESDAYTLTFMRTWE